MAKSRTRSRAPKRPAATRRPVRPAAPGKRRSKPAGAKVKTAVKRKKTPKTPKSRKATKTSRALKRKGAQTPRTPPGSTRAASPRPKPRAEAEAEAEGRSRSQAKRRASKTAGPSSRRRAHAKRPTKAIQDGRALLQAEGPRQAPNEGNSEDQAEDQAEDQDKDHKKDEAPSQSEARGDSEAFNNGHGSKKDTTGDETNDQEEGGKPGEAAADRQDSGHEETPSKRGADAQGGQEDAQACAARTREEAPGRPRQATSGTDEGQAAQEDTARTQEGSSRAHITRASLGRTNSRGGAGARFGATRTGGQAAGTDALAETCSTTSQARSAIARSPAKDPAGSNSGRRTSDSVRTGRCRACW